jgi:hypothetical protein
MDRPAYSILVARHLLVLSVANILPILLLTRGETEAGRWVGLAISLLITGTLGLWLDPFAHTKR